jgi:hypothetical protein
MLCWRSWRWGFRGGFDYENFAKETLFSDIKAPFIVIRYFW